MKLPRDLSGRELIRRLERTFGYHRMHQVGSHVVLQTAPPLSHRIAVPDHATLRVGTMNGIIRVVSEAQGLEKSEVFRRLFA